MPIIGNPVTQSAFIADTFNGGQTVYSMSVSPANTASVIVAVHGLVQDPSTYAVNGNTLTFTAAPPSGTGNVSARYLGVPASGVVTTAYRTVTDFTATSGQTIFTPPSYTSGFIDVYRNGIKLGAVDYTATNGTTVTLATASVAGDLVEIVSFYVSSVLNAIPAQAGAVGSTYLAPSLTLTGTTTASTITSAVGSPLTLQTNGGNTTAITVASGGYVGINSTTPSWPLDVRDSTSNSRLTMTNTSNQTSGLYLVTTNSGSTVSNATVRIDNSGNLQFFNGTSTATQNMTITATGPVQLPSNPAFFAWWTSGSPAYTVGSNPIIYSNVGVNRGSYYSASTGKFTAPVAGLYFFSMKNLQENTSSVIRYYFVQNGTVLGQGTGNDGAYQSRMDNTGTSVYREQQTSIIISCNANDTVWVCQYAGTVSLDSSGYSTFLGYLIG